MAIINQVTVLTTVLTGAALIRERERGALDHLFVMPLTSFDTAIAKVWANGLVILVAVALSLVFVVQRLLSVPLAGSIPLYLGGTALYLFVATALGIFLATIARSMAQFALLDMLVILMLQLLSGGSVPVESQPHWQQHLAFLLPSRRYVSFSQAIIYRGGAGYRLARVCHRDRPWLGLLRRQPRPVSALDRQGHLMEDRSMQIRRILAPTDFSEPSKQAIAYAFELAQTFGATLVLLHVIQELPPYIGFIPPAETTKALEELPCRARLDLAQVAPQAQDGKGKVMCQAVVDAQSPKIIDVAREIKADMIVIATRGRTGFRHFVMGSAWCAQPPALC